jgi:GTPase involved in cell partitioning and DNA repair
VWGTATRLVEEDINVLAKFISAAAARDHTAPSELQSTADELSDLRPDLYMRQYHLVSNYVDSRQETLAQWID